MKMGPMKRMRLKVQLIKSQPQLRKQRVWQKEVELFKSLSKIQKAVREVERKGWQQVDKTGLSLRLLELKRPKSGRNSMYIRPQMMPAHQSGRLFLLEATDDSNVRVAPPISFPSHEQCQSSLLANLRGFLCCLAWLLRWH